MSALSFANNNIINQKLSYKYDKHGNLTEVRTNNHLLARYSYDSLSRIVREDNKEFQKTFTFSYDAGGNITCKNEYAFTLIDNLDTLSPTNTFTYSYPATGWRDQLIGLNNEEFEYDNLGNPFVYRDKTLCWSHGRQLDKFDNVNFTYNANGIRTSKTFMGNTTKYYLNGSKILAQSDDISTIYFHYGIDGVTGFNLDGIEYLYN